jgi:hypothetical protein
MPLFADANRASLRYISEGTNWGVTPASGNTTETRLTSSSMVANKETVVSDELRSDRMVSSVPEVAATSSGDINYEFSAGSHDDFVNAFLQGTWSRDPNFHFEKGAHVSVDSSTVIKVTGDVTPYFKSGDRIRLSGFLEATNNTYWELSTDSTFAGGVTSITVTTATLVIEAGSAYTRIDHADDVIFLKSTGIESTADSFLDTGAFATAVSVGELAVGMTIFVDGLSYEEGTITITSAADAETVIVDDGVNSVTFEADDDASGPTVAGDITFLSGVSDTADATALVAAIMNQYLLGNLNVSATSAIGVVTIRNLNKTGGTLTGDTTMVAGAFAGGIATNTGFFEITAVDDDEITVTPGPGVQAAGDEVTIKASMVRNPSDEGVTLPHEAITAASFTIETAYNDIGQFMLQNGMRVGAYSMDLSTGAIPTGTFSFNGKETVRSGATTLGGGAYTVLGTTDTPTMNATTNVGSIKKDGSTLAAKLSALSFSGDASLRDQNAIGSKFPEGIGVGRFNLTGSITAYFEDGTLYDEFLSHDTVALSWRFTDLDDNVYVYTIPAVKFTSDPVSPGGIDQDVMEEIEWTAFRDPTKKTMMQIDRFSKTTPVGTS